MPGRFAAIKHEGLSEREKRAVREGVNQEIRDHETSDQQTMGTSQGSESRIIAENPKRQALTEPRPAVNSRFLVLALLSVATASLTLFADDVAFVSHPPMRPLPVPSRRQLPPDAVRFVDAESRDFLDECVPQPVNELGR